MAAAKTENPRKYEMKNVMEAFTIIARILDANSGIGLTQLSNCTHYTKNKTFRLLSTLEGCGIVEKDLQNNYNIGFATIVIAHKILAKATALNNVRPYMEGLVKVINEAVYFAYYTAGEAVLADYADCCQPVKAASFVGKAIKLPDSTSRVMSGNNVAMIGDITVDAGGLSLDITTVSMPFANERGVEVGVLVVLAPTFRMPLERIKNEIVPALREVMQRQQLQLSGSDPDRSLPLAHPVELEFGRHPSLDAGKPKKTVKALRGVRN